ncbi:MAG TPA: hypothetical protein VMI13_11855 [Solirubrobacteraceae bacterium]|nr:hypothetical protein [Solirubrobacteraceae bacterium]
MSRENLELVRSIYADWERGDWGSAAWAHPEIEFVIADGPVAFTSTGVIAMRDNWRSWLSAWEGFGMEAQEFRALDDERVLVLHRYVGRAKTSGVRLEEVHADAAIVMHMCNHLVTRLVGYNDRDHALTDLGLEE